MLARTAGRFSDYATGAELNSLSVVDPEKIRVQDGLYYSGYPGDLIDMAFCKVSVEPVRDV